MLGQGSPLTAKELPARDAGRRTRGIPAWLLLAAFGCALGAAAPSFAKEVNVRLWIAWGGASARAW